MKVVKHTFYHFLVHLALFTGATLLIPVITSAVDNKGVPWVLSPVTFFGGIMLVMISAFLLYKVKRSVPALIQSFGAMIFLPGALNVLFSVLDINDLFNSASGVAGMSFIKPATEFYIHHSVPALLGVAASYMAIGGVMYWMGLKLRNPFNR